MESKKPDLIYMDYHEGQTAYISDDAYSVVEVDEDREVCVKIYLPATFNWKRLAFELENEIQEIKYWMRSLHKIDRKPQFELMDYVYENDLYKENDEHVKESGLSESDKRIHALFYHEQGWMMYTNYDHYLFIWRGKADCDTSLSYEFGDYSMYPVHFIESWWSRTQGFSEEE